MTTGRIQRGYLFGIAWQQTEPDETWFQSTCAYLWAPGADSRGAHVVMTWFVLGPGKTCRTCESFSTMMNEMTHLFQYCQKRVILLLHPNHLPLFSKSLSSVQFSHSVVSNSLRSPWTAACQASLSITNSQSLLKLMPIQLVMPSNHIILCHPLLLLPSVFSSIRVFSNESFLHIRWPKYWSFSLAPVLPMNILNWFPACKTCKIKKISTNRYMSF